MCVEIVAKLMTEHKVSTCKYTQHLTSLSKVKAHNSSEQHCPGHDILSDRTEVKQRKKLGSLYELLPEFNTDVWVKSFVNTSLT